MLANHTCRSSVVPLASPTNWVAQGVRVFLVSLLGLCLIAAAQTKQTGESTKKANPVVGTGGGEGGPTGLFTIYDGSIIRRGEFTFSIAYSNYDRDPGIIDVGQSISTLGLNRPEDVSSSSSFSIPLTRLASPGDELRRLDRTWPFFAARLPDELSSELLKQGRSLEANGSPEALRQAIARYKKALSILRSYNDTVGVSEAYARIGDLHYLLSEYPEALANYGRSLSLNQSNAKTLTNMGVTYSALGEGTQALYFFNKALSVRKATGTNSEDPLLLYNIGLVTLELGESDKAVSVFNMALSRLSATQPEVKDPALKGSILNGLGSAYASSGEISKAISYYTQALETFTRMGNLAGESNALSNIGKIHNDLGEYESALSYLNKALRIGQKLGNKRMQANALFDVGNNYLNQNKIHESLDLYQESLQLFETIGDRTGQGLALNGIGRVYAASDKKEMALRSFNQALYLAREVENPRAVALTLADIGRLHKATGNLLRARMYYEEALSINVRLGDQNNEAGNLYEIGLLNRDLGQLDKSRAFFEKALLKVESFRTNIPGTRLRSSYLASVQKYYSEYIDLLMLLHGQRPTVGFHVQAFQVSERARARSLLESLGETRTDPRAGASLELLSRERSIQQALNSRAEEQIRLLNRPHTKEQVDRVAKEIAELSEQYRNIRSEIASRSPRYAALTKPEPLTLKAIQEQLLDKNTLLLSYALGDRRSFVFAVDWNSIHVYTLPGRKEIETTALQIYDLLTRQKVNNQGEKERFGPAKKEFEEINTRLSEMLLGPVSNQLGSKRLLVVAGGALQMVSFAGLSVPSSRNGTVNNSRVPLIVDHEIVNLPSASTLAVLRQETKDRKFAPKAVAVFADPVFNSDDARINSAAESKEQRTVNESFPRLLATRWEAEQIASWAPRSDSKLMLGFAATREAALAADLSQYRIVHFATHGLLNEKYPELSGIVLSRYDQSGRPQNGTLRLNEIYNLHLSAELVVLSACQTGLGKEVSGEGLSSITRGFMYAGSARVLVTLWPVDDLLTANLMAVFYKKMLVDMLPAASALQAAQKEMLKNSRWRSPYFWAPFVLHGEYR